MLGVKSRQWPEPVVATFPWADKEDGKKTGSRRIAKAIR
jgi:hypothetical protein